MTNKYHKSQQTPLRPSNVFVLSAIRCGSATFAKACSHIMNFTAGHETRCHEMGDSRLDYPEYHIESDNRLSWFLGRLDQKYGDKALYIHLFRNPNEVAESYNKRWTYPGTIVLTYARGVLKSRLLGIEPCIDYVRTVNENILLFLKDKNNYFSIDIADPKEEFTKFWHYISAEGDLEKAMAEFDERYNVSFINFKSGVASEFEDVKDKVINQLEYVINLFHKEREDLFKFNKNNQNLYEKLISQEQQISNKLQQKLEIKEKILLQLRKEIDTIQRSTAFSFAKVLAKNARSPIGWMKMPFSVASFGVKHFRSKFKKNGPSLCPHRLVFEASTIAKKTSLTDAIQFIKKHGNTEHQTVINLFHANKGLGNDSVWLKHVNAYLAQFDLAPLEVIPGSSKRFYRITAEPGYKKENGPKVSIIMPVFNAEKTITHSVSSILNQTFQNIELIIVDDASSDGSWNVIKKLAESDPRIKILRNIVNVGPYVSKNRALDYVKGSYITGHDADDWAHPQRIEYHLALMTAEPRVKASLAYMLRVNEQAEINHFCPIGKISFDGAARLAFISALIETETFINRFGYWDSVRFGADSELIERMRATLGLNFQTVALVSMLCLDIEGSLTNHPLHGIKVNNGGLSATRVAYRNNWMRWHENICIENAYLDFPHTQRKYDAPKEMLVDMESIKKLNEETPSSI